MTSHDLAEAIDLSHHLNKRSRSRHPSPIKETLKYMVRDGMISFAGGLPHPSLFPLQSATFSCLAPEAPIRTDVTARPKEELVSLELGRTKAAAVDLTEFLQYGNGAGNAQLLDVVRALTDRVHKPPYRYDVLMHTGNTNAWAKVVGLLCEDGDCILVEQYTYPSAQALWIPSGMTAEPVRADAQGMSAEHLESVLATWPASKGRRPRVLYTVSVGSNPMGLSISLERRKAIYEVCVKYDVIIVEDDPYYFLQYPGYQPEAETSAEPPALLSTDAFLASLMPSFLSVDREGRVIRLESFSKTVFPGIRLGFFVANPSFIWHLLMASQVETQDPSGLSQAFALALLRAWGGVDGFLGWMQSLQQQYRTRRDWLVGSIARSFVLQPAAASPRPDAEGSLVASLRAPNGSLKPVFSFVDPTAGMFVWTKFYFAGVPRFEELRAASNADPEQAFADELWMAFIDELILVTPGSYYHPWQGADMVTTKQRGADPATAHFRLSFATPTKEQIELGVQRLAHVLGKHYLAQ